MQGNWINKILDHQTPPPEGAWKHIAGELDKENDSSIDFKTKLLSYETAAPAVVLKNIFAELDKEETKVISVENNKRSRKLFFIRMTAAASVITIIALFYFSNQKTNTTEPGIASVTTSPKQPANNLPVKKEAITLPAPDTKEKNELKEIAFSPSKKEKITRQTPAQFPAYIPGNIIEELATNPVTASTEKLQNMQGDTPMDIALMNTPNAYISITGPDGQSIKVSSKLSNLVGFLKDNGFDTQENLDVIIKESAKWRTIFAAWRSKMVNNDLAPSLTNFMDIIELSEILEHQ